ncbi:MAG: helix-turn-helix transcriptional regulator [Actinomycetota bacterium]
MSDSTEPPSRSLTAPELPRADLLRKQLRVALTRARSDAGLTRQQVADELDWSQSKVIRIEQGSVPVAPSDVRVMLSIYKVTDAEKVDSMVALARQARDAKGWDQFGVEMGPAFVDLVAQEGVASQIWQFAPSVPPGVFQTEGYARALLEGLGHAAEDVDRRASLRAARQRILDRDPPPKFNVILSELIARRPVGGPTVMREQLRRLIQLGSRPNIDLHLLPMSVGAYPGMDREFTILQFDDDDLDDTVYLDDAQRRNSARDEPEEVLHYVNQYNRLDEMITHPPSCEQRFEEIIEELYTE